MESTSSSSPPGSKMPWGLKWRSSVWFVTLVVGFGITTDLLVYTIAIPVFPFRLEALAYSGVSSLVGWLLFAYSAGLVVPTIPIAMFSERYDVRRMPLIIGLVALLGSQVMLMEAPNYWVMVLARILQGVSSSMVWIVGLALLCDTVPEAHVGRQLGIAMMGLSIGFVVGPPVGGVLYGRLGYRAPFIFAEICTVIDLIGRLLIIERKDALLWGVDPAALLTDEQANSDVEHTSGGSRENSEQTVAGQPEIVGEMVQASTGEKNSTIQSPEKNTTTVSSKKPLSLWSVVIGLCKSSRALVALLIVLVYGIVYSSQEPTLPLHLQDVWGLNSAKVGLVFLAAVVPTLVSSPLTGWLADNKGSEWVTSIALLLAIPWWIIVIIQSSLPLFIVAFAIETFFTSGTISPVTAELAAVSRNVEGVGYAHVYGAFNLAYGVGTAVGPLLGGQIYDHVKRGWEVLCLTGAGFIALCLVLAFCHTGVDPLLVKLKRKIRRGGQTMDSSESEDPSRTS